MQMEHSQQFCVKESDSRSELSAEKNIWNRRKRSRTLRYEDCGL